MAAGNEFLQALRSVYQENPCQVLPSSLWQTAPRLADFELAVGRAGDTINRLEAWDSNSLYIYWRSAGRQPSLLIRRRLETVQLALMHQDFLDSAIIAPFTQTRQPYYRLLHRHETLPAAALPAGFRFDPIRLDVEVEKERVLAMIAHNETDFTPTNETVEAWMQPPVLAPDLWLWVKDERIGMPVGMVAGVLDADIGEAMLAWVQVIPAYQKRGLGRALVAEMVRRAAAAARFTTVTGAFHYWERDTAGDFFRGCGFAGDDVWWLLAR